MKFHRMSAGIIATAALLVAESNSEADRRFLIKTAEDNLFEMQLGEIAKDRASNTDVRSFADRMVEDHGRLQDEVKRIADQLTVTLPTELSTRHKGQILRLQAFSSEQFGVEYMALMVKEHLDCVAEYQNHARQGLNDALKAYASRNLPPLQDHVKQAQEILARIQKRTESGARSLHVADRDWTNLWRYRNPPTVAAER